MKYLLIFSAIFLTANAVLENNKALIEELSKIEEVVRDCDPNNKECNYKCAMKKLNYDTTASVKTESYRKFCKQNTTAITDDCQQSKEFVFCLHREVQSEINKLRDECAEKHGADMQAFRNEEENLVKKQSYACFTVCFLKKTGKMNEDMSFNFDENRLKNGTLPAMIEECAKKSEKEETTCSKAASRYYCLENKIHG